MKNPLSFLLLDQGRLNDYKNTNDESIIPNEELYNYISQLSDSFNQSNFDEFNLISKNFKEQIIRIETLQCLIIPFKQNDFPELILKIVMNNTNQLIEYSYFYLLLLCRLNDEDIIDLLIHSQILNICFSLIQQQTSYDYYLIDFIGSMISHLSDENLNNIIPNIPFNYIFANSNRHYPHFERGIFYLYSNIAEYCKLIPFPNLLFNHLNEITKFDKIHDKALSEILYFFIKMAEIDDLDLTILSLFIEEKTIFSFITYSISQSEYCYYFTIDFFKFCSTIYKYLKKCSKTPEKNKLALKIIKQIANIPINLQIFQEEEEEEEEYKDEPGIPKHLIKYYIENKKNLSTIIYMFSTEYDSDIPIIINYLKMYIKNNQNAIRTPQIKKICLCLFKEINEGSYGSKIAAFHALFYILKCSSLENCEFLRTQNIFQIFLIGFSIDDEAILKIVIDGIIYFIDKFKYGPNYKEVAAQFDTPEFKEAMGEVKERPEEWIVSICESLELRIHDILNDQAQILE